MSACAKRLSNERCGRLERREDSLRLVARRYDLAAWLIQVLGTPMLRVPERPRFSGQDLPDPEEILVPTSAGEVAAYVYRPRTSDSLPPVYVNLQGSGNVWRHPERDDHTCATSPRRPAAWSSTSTTRPRPNVAIRPRRPRRTTRTPPRRIRRSRLSEERRM